MRPLSKQRAAGFTLWDVVACLAVLAVVGVIVYPAFTSGRCYTHTPSCAERLKQLGTALRMYADDNNNSLPCSDVRLGRANTGSDETFCTTIGVFPPTADMAAGQYTIATCISSYVTSRDVFFCPSDTTNTGEPTDRISYIYRRCVDLYASAKDASESSFEYPSSQMVFVDRRGFHSGESAKGWAQGVKLNCAFIDGHGQFSAAAGGASSGATDFTTPGWPMHYNYDARTKSIMEPRNALEFCNPARYRDELR